MNSAVLRRERIQHTGVGRQLTRPENRRAGALPTPSIMG